MESFPQRAFQMMHRVLPEVSTEQSTREPAVWVNHGATLQEPKDTYNSTKNNNSMPPPLTYYSRVDTIVTCILIVLIVLLCVNLLALIYKPTRQWILNKYRSHPRIQSQRRQRRYNTIDQWIVRKHVQPHDGVCTALQSSHDVTRMNHWQVCQKLELKCTKTKCRSTTIDMSGEISSSSSSSSSSSGDDRLASTRGSDADHNDDEDKLTCCICLERFRVQDQVAWSPNPRCNHVYHHACIRDWLLRKTDCPYCRETVLPIDKAMQARQQQETDSDGNRSVALTSPNQSFDNDDGDIENPPNNNHDDAAAAAAAHAHAHAAAAAPAVEAAAAPASTITDQIQSPTATTSNDKPQPPSTPASLTRQENHLECSRQRTKRIKTTFVCVECGLVDLAAAPASAVCHDKL
jgi:hypothetical protein